VRGRLYRIRKNNLAKILTFCNFELCPVRASATLLDTKTLRRLSTLIFSTSFVVESKIFSRDVFRGLDSGSKSSFINFVIKEVSIRRWVRHGTGHSSAIIKVGKIAWKEKMFKFSSKVVRACDNFKKQVTGIQIPNDSLRVKLI